MSRSTNKSYWALKLLLKSECYLSLLEGRSVHIPYVFLENCVIFPCFVMAYVFLRSEARHLVKVSYLKVFLFFLEARGKVLSDNQKLDCESFSPPVCHRLSVIFPVFIFEDT